MTSALGPSGSTARWRRLRALILERDGYRCRMPTVDGTPCNRPADTVDHIVPRARGGTDAPENLRAACKACNSSAGATVRRPGWLVVVVGPPCAGKTTYVRAEAAEGDVIVDYDALAAALGAPDPYARPPGVARLALVARRAVVAALIASPPNGWRAWVIHSRPSAKQVRAYTEAGAGFVLLDPGEAVCRERARAERPKSWGDHIGEWYDTPPKLPTTKPGAKGSRW